MWTAKGFHNGFELGVGARYVSDQFIAEDNQFKIDGVLTFDASISYTYKQMKFRMNAKDLTDRKYATRGFGATSVIPSEPFGMYCAFEINLQ